MRQLVHSILQARRLDRHARVAAHQQAQVDHVIFQLLIVV